VGNDDSLGAIDKKNKNIETQLLSYLDDPNGDIRDLKYGESNEGPEAGARLEVENAGSAGETARS
jgi:hypothetical protein